MSQQQETTKAATPNEPALPVPPSTPPPPPPHYKEEKVISSADKTLIQYIQTAILNIKKDRVQCNLKSIFSYLKENYMDYTLVQTLNEKDLMKHLEMGVKEGILSRKFGGNSKSNPTAPSSAKLCDQLIKLPCSTKGTKDENLDEHKSLVSQLLPLLIKAFFSLNKENNVDTFFSLNCLCNHLSESYKFEVQDSQENRLVFC